VHWPAAWWRRSKLTEVSFCGPVQKRLEAGRARPRTLLERSRLVRVGQRAEASRRTAAPARGFVRFAWWVWQDRQRDELTEEADVVEREAEVGEGRAALEGAGEGGGAGAVEGVAGEVEEDEGGGGAEGGDEHGPPRRDQRVTRRDRGGGDGQRREERLRLSLRRRARRLRLLRRLRRSCL
jgi:hypothetical protein